VEDRIGQAIIDVLEHLTLAATRCYAPLLTGMVFIQPNDKNPAFLCKLRAVPTKNSFIQLATPQGKRYYMVDEVILVAEHLPNETMQTLVGELQVTESTTCFLLVRDAEPPFVAEAYVPNLPR
jgi:hypothetical protein